MPQPVSGSELKARLYETSPVPVGQLGDGHRILLDDPNLGPANTDIPSIAGRGIAKLPVKSVPAEGFPVGSPPQVPLSVGGTTGLYDLASATNQSIPYYLGPKQFLPTVNNQGGPLVAGNTCYLTTNAVDYVFTPSGTWVPVGSGGPAALKSYFYNITAGGTLVPPGGGGHADLFGNILEFNIAAGQAAKNSIIVHLNGSLLFGNADYTLVEGGVSGDYIQMITPMCAGSVVQVSIFGLPGVVFASSAVGVVSTSWVFNGTTKDFPMRDASNTAVVPGSTVNCLLVSGGRVLNPFTEFTVSGSTLHFNTAPLPGDAIFLVVGLPVSGGTTTLVAQALAGTQAALDQLQTTDTNLAGLVALVDRVGALETSLASAATLIAELQTQVSELSLALNP